MTAEPTQHQYATDALRAATEIRRQTGINSFDIALTLGSGWAKAAELIGETVSEIDASEVPGFSTSGIPGHTGTIKSIALPKGKYAPAQLILNKRP